MPITRRSFLIGIGFVGFMPTLAVAEPRAVKVGTVESIVGACTRRGSDGEKVRLALGSPIFMDDILATGADGRLGLRLGEATHLDIEEHTRVRIDRFLVDRGGYLILRGGGLLFDRPSAPAFKPFKVVGRPA
jgi:hypothetical protein